MMAEGRRGENGGSAEIRRDGVSYDSGYWHNTRYLLIQRYRLQLLQAQVTRLKDRLILIGLALTRSD